MAPATGPATDQVDSCHKIGESLQNLEISEREARGSFIHRPLEIDVQETRMLKVLPALSKEGLIRCEVQHVRLDVDHYFDFDALSYMWGSPKASSRKILINEARFRVRKNLWNFLSISRINRPGRWLWIDAICIDQANTKERNHQIHLMRKIYSSACEVLIWLGSSSSAITALMQVAQDGRLADRIAAVQSLREADRNETLIEEGSDTGNNRAESAQIKHDGDAGTGDIELADERASVPTADGHSLSFRKRSNESHEDFLKRLYYGDNVLLYGTLALDQHPYWHRVWIMQELLLSSQRKILHGALELSWRDFSSLMHLCHVWVEDIDGRTGSEIDIKLWAECRFWIWFDELHGVATNAEDTSLIQSGKSDWKMAEIVSLFDDMECTFPHDHVYGMLALSKTGQSFPVDYDCGMIELILNTFIFTLCEDTDNASEWLRWGSWASALDQANRLSEKLTPIPILRSQGVQQLYIPDLQAVLSCPIDKTRWNILRIDDLVAASTYGHQENPPSVEGLAVDIGFAFARSDELQSSFLMDDLVLLNTTVWGHRSVFIARGGPLKWSIVGRATYRYLSNSNTTDLDENTRSQPNESYAAVSTLSFSDPREILFEVYGPNGLSGTTFELMHNITLDSLSESKDERTKILEGLELRAQMETILRRRTSKATQAEPLPLRPITTDSKVQDAFKQADSDRVDSHHRQSIDEHELNVLGTFSFFDYRTIAIMFGLPDDLGMRFEAIKMLSDHDEQNAFGDTYFFTLELEYR